MKFKKTVKLSERLKYIRAHYGLSQAELADKAGTTQQAIQQAEKGKARQPRYLHRLAQELGIPIDWMIVGDAAKESPVVSKQSKGFSDQSSDILDQFFSMPEEDQKLMFELMKSRKKE